MSASKDLLLYCIREHFTDEEIEELARVCKDELRQRGKEKWERQAKNREGLVLKHPKAEGRC